MYYNLDMNYTISYGKEQINFKIPTGIKIDSVIPKQTTKITSIYKKTIESLFTNTFSRSFFTFSWNYYVSTFSYDRFMCKK